MNPILLLVVFLLAFMPLANAQVPKTEDLKEKSKIEAGFSELGTVLNASQEEQNKKIDALRNDFKNLEALIVEFADELALLNTKVSELEDKTAELKKFDSQMHENLQQLYRHVENVDYDLKVLKKHYPIPDTEK